MLRPALVALVALAPAACRFDTRPSAASDAAADAPGGDASGADAEARQRHLLLSEIKNNQYADDQDFVEIYNPTGATIDLRNVYLADVPLYARLPAVIAGDLGGAVADEDFVARFPSGAVIRPGEVAVVTMRSPFGLGEATFSVSGGEGAPMLEAFPGSIGAAPRLESDGGEMVALFFWNGSSDRVADVDLMVAGHDPAPGDGLPDKSGLAIDGPDADDQPTAYPDEAATLPTQVRGIGAVESTQRIALEDGLEGQGGSGLTGDDETSEDTRESWGFAAPNPGVTSGL